MYDNSIKITSDLKFGYADLMKVVDFSQEFTLKDVISICNNSKIPLDVLSNILNCNVLDYIEELKKNNADEDKINDMDYLELYWWGTKHTWEGVREDSSMWGFHGVGKLGHISEDVLKYCKLTKKQKLEYREKYAVEFTPVYKLANYVIKISKNMHVTDYDCMPRTLDDLSIDLIPSITLIDLLYAIFYEISFCGSPSQRDGKMSELQKMVKELDAGTLKTRPLDLKTYSSKEVLRRVTKKIKETKKSKGD